MHNFHYSFTAIFHPHLFIMYSSTILLTCVFCISLTSVESYEYDNITNTVKCPDENLNVPFNVTELNKNFTKVDETELRSIVANTTRWPELEITCTTGITNMSQLFFDKTSFNNDIGRWDTSAVTTMNQMFRASYNFNSSISGWDTSAVVDMTEMFYGARAFNVDISNWNTGNVEDMQYMFADAQAFDGDISNWNTEKVEDMQYMFDGALQFNGDLSSWCVELITSEPGNFSLGSILPNASQPRWGNKCLPTTTTTTAATTAASDTTSTVPTAAARKSLPAAPKEVKIGVGVACGVAGIMIASLLVYHIYK